MSNTKGMKYCFRPDVLVPGFPLWDFRESQKLVDIHLTVDPTQEILSTKFISSGRFIASNTCE